MEDVELLVTVLYDYQDHYDKLIAEAKRQQAIKDALEEEEQAQNAIAPSVPADRTAGAQRSNNGVDATNSASGGNDESEDEEEKDPT